jgi:hypothetical protein
VPQPRISQIAQQITDQKRGIVKNSPEAHAASLPQIITDPDAVAAEEQLQKQLVQRYRDEEAAAERQLAGTPVATPPAPGDEIAQRAYDLAVEEAARRTSAKEQYRGLNEAKIKPLVTRLEAAKQAMKELRSAALVKVTAWAGIDAGALVRGYRWRVEPFVPGTAPGPNGEPGTASSGGISGGERVALLQRAAAQAVSAMKHQFSVSDDAVRRANVSASADPESQEWRMAADHLRKSVATSESSVAAGQSAVASAEALYVKVRAALAEAAPIDNPVMPPVVEWLPNLPGETPKSGGTSYFDWDPREPLGPQIPRDPAPGRGFNLPDGPDRRGRVVGVEGA